MKKLSITLLTVFTASIISSCLKESVKPIKEKAPIAFISERFDIGNGD